METETWYILEDNEVGDPRDISPDNKGVLRHKDGRAVAYAPHGPRSRGGVDPDEERKKAFRDGKKSPNEVRRESGKPLIEVEPVKAPAAKAKDAPPASNREIKAEGGKATYKTRTGAKWS